MIQENISLRPFNTFGIDSKALYFTRFSGIADLNKIRSGKEYREQKHLILGGGSNILLTQDFNGLVIKNEIKGIEKIKEDNEHVYVRAGAGEVWHNLVMYCIDNNWAGLENLSLIPGNVGASPMQNIGAYGVEIKETFESLEAYSVETGEIRTFNASQCEFGYRESVFKGKEKGKYIILNVTYRLNKTPVFNTRYGAIEEELKNMGVHSLSIKAISQAVINIRTSKLPNPVELGNAGSFFKNPVVPTSKYLELKQQFPDIVGYKSSESETKLAAGWMIESCGLKGFTQGRCGVHKKQALVLVNYGGASGKEIYDLSSHVVAQVKNKFGVELEREVNIV